MDFICQISDGCDDNPEACNAVLVTQTDGHQRCDVAFVHWIAGTILGCRRAPRQLQGRLPRSGRELRRSPWLQSMSWRAFACSCSSRLPHQSPLQLVTSRYLAPNQLLTVSLLTCCGYAACLATVVSSRQDDTSECQSHTMWTLLVIACISPLQLWESHAAKNHCAASERGAHAIVSEKSRSPTLGRVMRQCPSGRCHSPTCQHIDAVQEIAHGDCSRESAGPFLQMVLSCRHS